MAPKSAVRVSASGSAASNSRARAGARGGGALVSTGDCGRAAAVDVRHTAARVTKAAHPTWPIGSRLTQQVYGRLGRLARRGGRTHLTAVRWVAGVAGGVLLAVVLWDAFETIILPRRVSGRIRLTKLFYRFTWKPWRGTARLLSGRRRDAFLSFYGPLSLILLLALWAAGIVFAFGLLQWAAGSALTMAGVPSFGADVYMSGTTFFTLGLGDVVPRTPLSKLLTTVEAGMGFAFLAVVIGYFPVIYQSFSMARHAVVDLAQVFSTPPGTAEDRLPPAELERLRARLASGGMRLKARPDFAERLAELRRMYEPYVIALARYLALPLPPWIRAVERPDNWQTSAWDRVVRLPAREPTRGGEEHF